MSELQMALPHLADAFLQKERAGMALRNLGCCLGKATLPWSPFSRSPVLGAAAQPPMELVQVGGIFRIWGWFSRLPSDAPPATCVAISGT